MQASVQPSPPSSPADFQKILDEWVKALTANDPEQIRSCVESDWQLVDAPGIMALEDFIEAIERGDLVHDEMTLEVIAVQHIHDVAIVISQRTNTGSWQGEEFSVDQWCTDVFAWQHNRWVGRLTTLTPREQADVIMPYSAPRQ